MNITAFFADVLGSSLCNSRWSWGSVNQCGQVFLRVWEDEFQTCNGRHRVLVLQSQPRSALLGYRERQKHLSLIQNGALGFGVLCKAAHSATGETRKLKSFDCELLLVFGNIISEADGLYAEVLDRVPVGEIIPNNASETSLSTDLNALFARQLNSTQRNTLVQARVGQGRFRAQVLERWGNQCAVTRVSTLAAIRASHIKPWRFSNDMEKLDPRNGLPLIASLDALFDVGLVGFSTTGIVQVSELLPTFDQQILGLSGARLRYRPDAATAEYLAFHAKNVFQG